MSERRGKRMRKKQRKRDTSSCDSASLSLANTHRPLPRFTSVLPDCFHRGVLSAQHRPALWRHLLTLFPRFRTMLDGLRFDTRQTWPTSKRPTYYSGFSPIHAKSTQLTTLLTAGFRDSQTLGDPAEGVPFHLHHQPESQGESVSRTYATSSVCIWHNLAPRSF